MNHSLERRQKTEPLAWGSGKGLAQGVHLRVCCVFGLWLGREAGAGVGWSEGWAGVGG